MKAKNESRANEIRTTKSREKFRRGKSKDHDQHAVYFSMQGYLPSNKLSGMEALRKFDDLCSKKGDWTLNERK